MRFTTRYNRHFPPFSTALAKALFNMILDLQKGINVLVRNRLHLYIIFVPADAEPEAGYSESNWLW